MIGVGMVVASSCVSGLFYKLGSGMLGTLAGLAGWVAGELAARHVHLPGPTVLAGGQAATFAGVTGVPRLALSVLLLALVAGALWRWRPAELPAHPWQWNAPQFGIALGMVTVAGWVLAERRLLVRPEYGRGFRERGVRVTELVADRVPAGHRRRRCHRRPDSRRMAAAGRDACSVRPAGRGRLPARRGRLDRGRLQPRARPVRRSAAERLIVGGCRVHGRRSSAVRERGPRGQRLAPHAAGQSLILRWPASRRRPGTCPMPKLIHSR